MKRTNLIIILLLIVSVSASPIVAKENNISDEEDYNKLIYTTEVSMPVEITERKKWISETTEYNEKHFNQRVISVIETEEMIVFVFERNKSINIINDSDEHYYGIDRVEYIKPESNGESKDRANSFKFTYYYGCSGYYTSIDSKSRSTYNALKALIIKWASSVNETAGDLMEIVTGLAEALFDASKPASIQTYNQYFYYNKVCSVMPSGMTVWFPSCQIGKRFAFTKEIHSVYEIGNYLNEDTTYKYQWDTVTVPPTIGVQCIEPLTKAHYNDNTWMKNKAVETLYSGGYVDVYGIAMEVHVP